MALSNEARSWLDDASKTVFVFMKQNKLLPFDGYFHLDLNVYLSRANSDSHNYLKLLCDSLELGGLTTNDKFIMPRIQNVNVDRDEPRIEMTFSSSDYPSEVV